jgi:hypothetical protein
MKRKDDNSFYYNGIIQLDKNLSRLVKLTCDPDKPTGAFTQSLISNALGELRRSVAANKGTRENILVKVSWLDKAVGWAAMGAAACAACLAFVVAALLKLNSCLAAMAIMTMFANWLNRLGELIL